MTEIIKKEASFTGAQAYGVVKMILDLENKTLKFYVSKGEAMDEVDFKEFESAFHEQAFMCIKSDVLREDYLHYERKIKEFIDEYIALR